MNPILAVAIACLAILSALGVLVIAALFVHYSLEIRRDNRRAQRRAAAHLIHWCAPGAHEWTGPRYAAETCPTHELLLHAYDQELSR